MHIYSMSNINLSKLLFTSFLQYFVIILQSNHRNTPLKWKCRKLCVLGFTEPTESVNLNVLSKGKHNFRRKIKFAKLFFYTVYYYIFNHFPNIATYNSVQQHSLKFRQITCSFFIFICALSASDVNINTKYVLLMLLTIRSCHNKPR